MNLWGIFFMFVFMPVNLIVSTITINILELKAAKDQKRKNGGEMQHERVMQYS